VGLRRIGYEAEGWGAGELWVEHGVLVWHELPRPAGPPRASSRFQPTVEPVTEGSQVRAGSVTILELAERLRSYFAGDPKTFDDVEIDLGWCTAFQRAVTAALRGIPGGETVTYGELAALAGYPNAQRAAGTFCARNRFPILVPCHRVVAADGIGSYGSLGIEYKRRLLELEHGAL
jgi:methylated-DNA-[protein]-cysteine S-methyltransferase